jgi:hypothetical protein
LEKQVASGGHFLAIFSLDNYFNPATIAGTPLDFLLAARYGGFFSLLNNNNT